MVEAALRRRGLRLLREGRGRSPAHHGPPCAFDPRGEKYKGESGSRLQELQQSKKIAPADRVERVPGAIGSRVPFVLIIAPDQEQIEEFLWTRSASQRYDGRNVGRGRHRPLASSSVIRPATTDQASGRQSAAGWRSVGLGPRGGLAEKGGGPAVYIKPVICEVVAS
jgi:hypothetical protein